MITIGNGVREEEATAPGMLRGCHRRIRHFAALASRLAASPDAPAGEIADAAASIHRYFTVALPLHHADEEESIRPRLPRTPGLERALASMQEQHQGLETRLATLVPLWSGLAAQPETAGGLAESVRRATADFEAACEEHLHLEEEAIFPAIDELPSTEIDAILSEMRARRA